MPEEQPRVGENKVNNSMMERVEERAIGVAYRMAYWLMWFLNPGHTYSEIRNGEMDAMQASLPEISNEADATLVLGEARRVTELEEQRREVIDDKSKVLLTVSALLLAANAAMLPHLPLRWLGLVPISNVFASVFLTLMYFRTYRTWVVDPSEIDWTDAEKAKRAIACIEFECAEKMGHQNELRVGVHRAARRALVLALVAIMPMSIWIATVRPTDPMIERLETDIKLRALLQGPRGKDGATGPAGPQGPVRDVGPAGPQGQPGPPAMIDKSGGNVFNDDINNHSDMLSRNYPPIEDGLPAWEFDDDENSKTPESPPSLYTDRTAVIDFIRVSWIGGTTDYDIQDCYQDTGTGEWSEPHTEELRPAKQISNGKYFRDEPALPQPMRFRVRAVDLDENGKKITSDWTEWIVSEPLSEG